MKIQSLKESDLAAIKNLSSIYSELAMDRDSVYWLFSEFFANTSFVVYSNNKLVGFILGLINQTDQNQGYVYSIGVAVDYRGQGIGKLLVETFQERVKSLGVDTVYLTTTSENQRALAFYEYMGFSHPEQFLKFGQKRLRLMKPLD